MAYAIATAAKESASDTLFPTEGLGSGFGGLASIVKNYDQQNTFSNKATAKDIMQNADEYCCPNCDEGTGQDTAYAKNAQTDNIIKLDSFRNQSAVDESVQDIKGLDGLTAITSESAFAETDISTAISKNEHTSVYDPSTKSEESKNPYGSSSSLSGLLERSQNYSSGASFNQDTSSSASIVLDADNYCCPGCDEGVGHQSDYVSSSKEPVVSVKENYQSRESAQQQKESSSNISFDFSTGIESLTTEIQTEVTSSESEYSGNTSQSNSAIHYEKKQSTETKSVEKISISDLEGNLDIAEVVFSLDNSDSAQTQNYQTKEHSTNQNEPVAYASASVLENIQQDAVAPSQTIPEENYSADSFSVVGSDSVITQYVANDNVSLSSEAVNNVQEESVNISQDSRIDLASIVASENLGEGYNISFNIDFGDSVLIQYASNENQENISNDNYQAGNTEAIIDKIESNYQSSGENVVESVQADFGNDLSRIVSTMVENRGEGHSVTLESGDSVLVQYASNNNEESASTNLYQGKKENQLDGTKSTYQSRQDEHFKEALEGVVDKESIKYQPQVKTIEPANISYSKFEEKEDEKYHANDNESRVSDKYQSSTNLDTKKISQKSSTKDSREIRIKKTKEKVRARRIDKQKQAQIMEKEASRKKLLKKIGGKNDRRHRKTRQKTNLRISTTRRKRRAV